MVLERIFSYLPSYKILNKFFPYGKKEWYFYIDLKGCMRKIFKYDVCTSIIQDTLSSKLFNLSLVWDLLSLISYHNYYIINNGLDVKYFIFLDIGTSIYHKNIFSEYKAKRESFKFLDSNELNSLYDILNKNYLFLKKISTFIPNFYVILLENIESDFIPYYLIMDKFKNKEDVLHIIYSPDKDMHQCLIKKDILQLFISSTRYNILDCDNLWYHVFEKVSDKLNCNTIDIDLQYYPLYLALIGDRCDNISSPKITSESVKKRIGFSPIKFYTYYSYIKEICDNMEDIYRNIYENNELLPENKRKLLLESSEYNEFVKLLSTEQDIIIRNLKLISFHYLVYYYLLKEKTFFTQDIVKTIDESIIDDNKRIQNSRKIFDILVDICKLKGNDGLFNKIKYLSFG